MIESLRRSPAVLFCCVANVSGRKKRVTSNNTQLRSSGLNFNVTFFESGAEYLFPMLPLKKKTNKIVLFQGLRVKNV